MNRREPDCRWFGFVGLAGLGLLGLCGCRPAPIPTPPAIAEAPWGTAIGQIDSAPAAREAYEATQAFFRDAVAGRSDDPAARKVAGFQEGTVEEWRTDPEQPASRVTFRGTMTGPGRKARFEVLMVKQMSGRWMVAVFRELPA